MMGYLTAVEEYLSRVEQVPFDVETLVEAARALDAAAYAATRYARERDFAVSFEDAVRAVYGESA
jgi:hypothetical protein